MIVLFYPNGTAAYFLYASHTLLVITTPISESAKTVLFELAVESIYQLPTWGA